MSLISVAPPEEGEKREVAFKRMAEMMSTTPSIGSSEGVMKSGEEMMSTSSPAQELRAITEEGLVSKLTTSMGINGMTSRAQSVATSEGDDHHQDIDMGSDHTGLPAYLMPINSGGDGHDPHSDQVTEEEASEYTSLIICLFIVAIIVITFVLFFAFRLRRKAQLIALENTTFDSSVYFDKSPNEPLGETNDLILFEKPRQ
jgi:hypothetical protein